MALLGKAAMVLSFDVAADAIDEHDDWHTHEHFPERLSIPGFLRGTRWIAQQGHPRYFVLYEVEEVATLASAPYLDRLNNPTPWAAKMMTQYRGMTRGFCTVTDSLGVGLGQTGLLIRFKPAQERETELQRWLLEEELPQLPSTRGLASAHLLKAALAPPTTSEQRIRGSDSGMDWALLVTGYSGGSVADLLQARFREEQFQRRGASGFAAGVYRIEYSLTKAELSACRPSSSNRT
jgi:hypothetical protein